MTTINNYLILTHRWFKFWKIKNSSITDLYYLDIVTHETIWIQNEKWRDGLRLV